MDECTTAAVCLCIFKLWFYNQWPHGHRTKTGSRIAYQFTENLPLGPTWKDTLTLVNGSTLRFSEIKKGSVSQGLASLLTHFCLYGKGTYSCHKQVQFSVSAVEHSTPFPLTILMSVEGGVLHTNNCWKPGKKGGIPTHTICGLS